MTRFTLALKRLTGTVHELCCHRGCKDYGWQVKTRLAGYRGKR